MAGHFASLGNVGMESMFKNWLAEQTSAQGKKCTPSTVNHNYQALNKVLDKMMIQGCSHLNSIFEITDLNTFKRIKNLILTHRDFESVNKAFANGYLRTGLNWYEKFLTESPDAVSNAESKTNKYKDLRAVIDIAKEFEKQQREEMPRKSNAPSYTKAMDGETREKAFRKWMASQDSAKGGKCSESAINNNCNALNKVFSKMEVPGFRNMKTVFEVDNAETFIKLKNAIYLHRDFDAVNKACGNGYLRTGLNWYERYLNDCEEMTPEMKTMLKELEELAKESRISIQNAIVKDSGLRHPITNEKIILTKEQQNCVDYSGDKRKDLVIRSAAGGGKSLVLIDRALQFLKDARVKNRANAVAVFTYNHVLANYLKEWMKLKPSDSRYIYVGTLHEYLNSVYSNLPGKKLGYQAYEKVVENCCNETLKDYSTRIHDDKYKKWGAKFWNAEFNWMRSMNVFERGDEASYLNLEREGRGHEHNMYIRDRRAAFEMFCMFQDKLRTKKVFVGESAGDERILYLTHKVKNIPDDKRFDHVLIDEAQDQTLAKMIALKSLAREDVTVCMDANQRIYEGRWKFKQWGNPASKRLSYPFRCTDAIDELAESLKANNQSEMDEDDIVEHIAATAHGEKPEIVRCDNEDEEKRYLIYLIQKWMKEDPQHTIGVMCYKNDAVDKVGRWLGEEHIAFDYVRNNEDANYSIKSPGVKLCTMHTSKGLEFMRVILPQFYQGMIPQRWAVNDEEEMIKQRNVAYVGMTRAMHQLVIIYNGNKSQFVDEMDSDLYHSYTYRQAIQQLKKPVPQYQKRELPKEETGEPKRIDHKSKWKF